MMISKNLNFTISEDDLLPTLYRCVCNFWISLTSATKHLKLLTTTKSSDMPSSIQRKNPNIIPSLPTLPFDLIIEILSRLPVKTLVQFRCVCKSWNSLISHHKFSRNHFKLSTTPNLHEVSYDVTLHRYVLKSYPLESVFTDLTTNFTQLEFPFNRPYEQNSHHIVGSCDGILCLANFYNRFLLLWNPSIRKFKRLPPFENRKVAKAVKYGFGYDHVSHNYKVVAVYNSLSFCISIHEDITKIKVYNLSTNSWSNMQTLSFPSDFSSDQSGIHVSGTINWLASLSLFIVSFDLSNESYKKICPPENGGIGTWRSKLCRLKDCLCIISNYDVWVMKEYGVKESWTKLFKVSNLPDQGVPSSFLTRALYIFEDDQVLLEEKWRKKFIIYDFKNHTFKVTAEFQTLPEICTENLISPCS